MKIGTFRGIGVYIHWTFWLLIALYLVSATMQAGLAAGLYAVMFVMSIFGCVLLHEFGHAAAAAYFGIPTADITLLPFGGVARLSRLPSKPIQELIIALAGPAVNVVIAALLFPLVAIGVAVGDSVPLLGSTDLLAQLLIVNVVLILFNLLPAFPMDGGRVLRSLLAMRIGHLRATELAARVGRWMAFAFGVYGVLSGNFGLLLVAGFVFLAGTAELLSARAQAAGPLGGSNGPVAWRMVWPPQSHAAWNASPGGNSWGATPDSTSNKSPTPGPSAFENGPQVTPRRPTPVDVVDAVQVRHLN